MPHDPNDPIEIGGRPLNLKLPARTRINSSGHESHMLIHGSMSRITESTITRVEISGFDDGAPKVFNPAPGVDWKIKIWFDHVHDD
ncbi:MAG: hypothetical protein AABN33_05820 [Acidobacteriota bacterium]